MLNLAPFETPPLGRQERPTNTIVTATAAIARGNEESSSNTCLQHGHLDLSLGISLSHGGGGGGGSCDASSCGGNKQDSYGGGQGSRDDKDNNVRRMTSCIGGTATANVITAGHSSLAGDLTAAPGGGGGGGWAAAFMPSPTGFMHPWSLAARQQKAAAEQDRTPPATYLSSSDDRVVTSPSAVGWPPVHTSRRNIVSAMHVITNKQTAGASSAVAGNGGTPPGSTTTATHTGGGETNGAAAAALAARPALAASSMFAKVHMEGYAIGRKVNLRAQDGYDSLSRTLTNMATNFFCPADCSGAAEKDAPKSDKFIFLYEDFEGDRMLVGDVPLELFLASAKGLYIVRKPSIRRQRSG
uniref:Auxin-responsive protein n=1 Tax=Zea mays TaxID=4577 RepID=B4FXM6_MAIZE